MNDTKAKYIANHIAEWVYQHLISTTQIDRQTARMAAVNAANKAAQSLQCDLKADREFRKAFTPNKYGEYE